MPISPLKLQRRLTEVGRIRIGEVKAGSSGRGRPAKLDRFRFTSADKSLLEKVAALYGGEVKAWTPQGGGAAQWEVITNASSVPVVVPPQPVTQWFETWSGGGCQRRCDGDRDVISDKPCLCTSSGDMTCKPTTRLSVMLREVESIGVWRLESHGWNAAAELPGMAELLAQAGSYVNARLILRPVRQVSGGQTKDFIVPMLVVDGLTPEQLLAGARGGEAPALSGGAAAVPSAVSVAPPALGAAGGRDWYAAANAAGDPDMVRAIWRNAQVMGELTDELRAALTARGEALKADAAAAVTPEEPVKDLPAVAPSEVDELWSLAVAEAGKIKPVPWSMSKLRDEFGRLNDGESPSSATPVQMHDFLEFVRTVALS